MRCLRAVDVVGIIIPIDGFLGLSFWKEILVSGLKSCVAPVLVLMTAAGEGRIALNGPRSLRRASDALPLMIETVRHLLHLGTQEIDPLSAGI